MEMMSSSLGARVHGTLQGPWLGLEPTGRIFTCAFSNVVPFVGGKMQGEKILFDILGLCSHGCC